MKFNKILLIFFAAIIIINGLNEADHAQKIVLLDVGQGDAILLADGNKQILVDGGPGMKVLSRLSEEMPWFDRRIEAVILTHPEADHLEGLMHVIERYEVGLILIPRVPKDTHLNKAWIDEITRRGLPYRFAWEGQEILAGDMTVKILSPQDNSEYAVAAGNGANNASAVARIDYCAKEVPCLSYLLGGDIEEKMERYLIRTMPAEVLDTDIVKLSHHGSKTSSSEAWLEATSPQAAMVSVGEDNQYGHPHPTVLARLKGIPLWRTDKQGSVRFEFEDGWKVRSYPR